MLNWFINKLSTFQSALKIGVLRHWILARCLLASSRTITDVIGFYSTPKDTVREMARQVQAPAPPQMPQNFGRSLFPAVWSLPRSARRSLAFPRIFPPQNFHERTFPWVSSSAPFWSMSSRGGLSGAPRIVSRIWPWPVSAVLKFYSWAFSG